jgi:hypothetical protein
VEIHRHAPGRKPRTYALHNGRSRKPIVKIVPDESTGLHRVMWPDIGPSLPANLTRCKQAALEWAEMAAPPRDRKTSAARYLKSLDNFSWQALPVGEKCSAVIRNDSCAEKRQRPFYAVEVTA